MAFSAIIFFIVISYVHANGNVCDSRNHVTISDIRRRTENKVNSNFMCDYGFIKDGGWYRFKSAAGNQMPRTNPGLFSCGTYVPIWFKGTHPDKVNHVVNAQACAAVPFIQPKDTGCGISYDIKVVKCQGDFYLYQLKEPEQCSLAYCAGTELPKEKRCSYTGDSLPICSGVIPTLGQVAAGIKVESSIYVRLRCFWKSPGNLTYVEYEARWFNDEKDLKPKIERRFSGTDKLEFLFQPFNWNDKENKTIGYEFRKRVFCQVRARYKSGNWSSWKSSNKIFTGISISPTEIPVFDCGDIKREVIVTLRPHLPIRKMPVMIDLFSPRTSFIDEICVVGGEKEFSQCGLIFQTNHTIGSPLRFKLLTICGTGDTDEKLNSSYILKGSWHPHQNIFWKNYKYPEIKLYRTKFKKQKCTSWGDPHFITFDGNEFNFMGRGTFLLYRNTYYGTEIQVRQRACGAPACNCGVAIKEKTLFAIYDLCAQSGGKWWEKNLRTRMYSRFSEDFRYSRFFKQVMPTGSETKIEVNLPSGVAVIATRYSWGFDINVWAPVDSNHPSEGLCGNNNKDPNDYYSKWSTPDEFGEHWRIRSIKTIFDYRSIIYDERLDRGCGKKICVCSRDPNIPVLCGDKAEEKVCFRSLTGKPKAFGRVCNNVRKRRALQPDDDSIDDLDDIPPFNPPEVNISVSLTWPTPNGLTKAEVTQYCENKLRYSKAGKACSTVKGVDIDSLVKSCIYDIQATDDFYWGSTSFSTLETTCTASIYNNASSFKSTSNGSIELTTDVLLSLCPNDCSYHGNCSNSTCTCHEDYTAADCSISLKDSPILFDIRKSGLCDRRRRPCRNVGVFGFPLLDTENLTCHVQEHKIIESSWTPTNSVSLYPGLMVDLTEVKCSLPESPVNIGDYGNEGVTAAGLKIAVSNNRINASKEPVLFITYDSVCQECNTTAGCKLRTDACIISGHCFAKNQSHPNDWCQQCLPELSTTSWLERRDNRRPTFTTSNVFYTFKGKELRVQLSATDPENRTIRYSFVQNETFGASLKESGLFSWTMNGNDSTIFMFKVRDECEAYSVFNVSVITKECPCQNFGECIPDYRYLDGAGNFTCSCPAEYTGPLCELDVDECNVSKPCFNGNCNNLQPGFSCSCFAGYTGDLCQNEIDECASNPCFLGVPCTDRIASFSCGPCPNGYSGNGENCTRIDGKVDECVKNPQVCHSNGKCAYSNGSYVCQCTHGYIGDGKNNCTDVDECIQSPGVCDTNANCTNTEGSYTCECFRGYTGDGERNCSDIDECTSPNVCIQNAQCSNTVGTYVCQCAVGYSGDGYSNCTDVNECNTVPSICHQNATCTNSEGSYSCQCGNGYSGDGKINCTDINECIATPNICHGHANCSNVQGSYSCDCRTGFSGDGKLSCDDINECQQSPSVCHPLAKCSNTEGSFSCQCGVGYTGNGFVNCTDVDECSQSVSVCHQHAECTNTIGSYSCQCKQGFLGDGTQNCAENQPPYFTIPSEVYAILNNDFQIQVMAEDPENQDMTFTLLSNGTLTTARITKQLLEISNLKQNGTIYVQVEDEMGAKNIFILQVNAMECPCEHNGKCNQKQTVSYPVQPSDYLCQCEDPYTGDLCEIRPNPCDKLPCYPGLECSPAQNSEGLTCEECPPLFQGDGKQCELKETEERSSVKSEMTLTNQKWDDLLETKTSDVYKNLASQLTIEIRNIYKTHTGFSYVIIKGFRPGSIIVDFELIFTKEVEDPLEPLMEVVKTGKLGNMTVKMETTQDEGESDSSEKKIFGLDKTIFFVIVGAAVVFILMIIVAIYLRVKRHRTHRVAMLRARILNTSDKKPLGIAFQPTNASGSEEIDLKVFDNEAIHLDEEIKIQP